MATAQNMKVVYKGVRKTQNAQAAAVEVNIARLMWFAMQISLIVIIVNLIRNASAIYV